MFHPSNWGGDFPHPLTLYVNIMCWKHGRLHSPLGGSSKFDGGGGTWINTLGELEGASKKRENILLISVLSCVSWKSYFSVKLKTLSTKIKVSYNYIPTTNYILPWVSTNLNQYFLKKMKKIPGDIIILHNCTKNKIICYTVSETWCVVD